MYVCVQFHVIFFLIVFRATFSVHMTEMENGFKQLTYIRNAVI